MTIKDLNTKTQLLELAQDCFGEDVNPSDDLIAKYGFDSLSIVEFERAIEVTFGAAFFAGGEPASLELIAAKIDGDAGEATTGMERVPDGLETMPAGASITVKSLPDAAGSGLGSQLWSLPGGRELETFTRGEGLPVVLLPPFNCEAVAWTPVIEELSKHYEVTTINYPGFGRAVNGWEDLDDRKLASAVGWVLSQMFEHPVALVGWSLGGFLAQRLSKHQPRLVKLLVLTNTTACLEQFHGGVGTAPVIQAMRDDLEVEIERLAGMAAQKTLESWVYAGADRRPAQLWVKYINLVYRYDIRYDTTPINIPTLIVAGQDDVTTPVRYAEQMRDSIPNATLEIVEHSGHYTPLFSPGQFCAIVAQWLGEHDY